MTASRALNSMVAWLFARVKGLMVAGLQLWLAPILNVEGMGFDHPYLWPGQAPWDVAHECNVSRHPGVWYCNVIFTMNFIFKNK
jgi:hypothetical protein